MVGALAAILVVSGAISAGVYSFFKDDLVINSVAEQSVIRQEYELRISELYRQMDTLVSRHIVERETLGVQVADLVDRQSDLVERQQLLTGLASDALAAGIDVLPMLAPVPLANPLRDGPAETNGVGGPLDPLTTGAVEPDQNAGMAPTDAIAVVAIAADWVEESQREALEALAEAIAERFETLAEALRSLGYRDVPPNTGGPFVPNLDPVDFVIVEGDLDEFERLLEFARQVPLSAPLAGLDVTSSFGRRVDPFLGQSATHTGVDFRAATGATVRATAPGTVVTASVNGGYGKMVEIDHGNGVSTAYAHLSSISVRVGDTVGSGAVVGRAGSTGRSTGPHLHYEIRQAGRAINPMPHIRAGAEIAHLL